MTEIERRYTKSLAELRAAESGARTIGGYAAVFGKLSANLGGFVELVDSRAFNQSKGNGFPDVVARFNHDNAFMLGTTASGTLRLSTDREGLSYSVDVPVTRQDVFELVTRGDVTKSSFAFRTLEDSWDLTEAGFPQRTLIAVQLVDVAPVTTPAYPDASVGLRSLAERCDAPMADVEALAKSNELRKLLTRTDRPTQKTIQQLRVELMAKRNPSV